jgi:hypothetical protein
MRKKMGGRFATRGRPRFKKWVFINRASEMSKTWLTKEAEGTVNVQMVDIFEFVSYLVTN